MGSPFTAAFFTSPISKPSGKCRYKTGDTQGGARVPVTRPGMIGSVGNHWTRNIAFAPDGKSFFVAIGSNSNLDEEPSPQASGAAVFG